MCPFCQIYSQLALQVKKKSEGSRHGERQPKVSAKKQPVQEEVQSLMQGSTIDLSSRKSSVI